MNPSIKLAVYENAEYIDNYVDQKESTYEKLKDRDENTKKGESLQN